MFCTANWNQSFAHNSTIYWVCVCFISTIRLQVNCTKCLAYICKNKRNNIMFLSEALSIYFNLLYKNVINHVKVECKYVIGAEKNPRHGKYIFTNVDVYTHVEIFVDAFVQYWSCSGGKIDLWISINAYWFRLYTWPINWWFSYNWVGLLSINGKQK